MWCVPTVLLWPAIPPGVRNCDRINRCFDILDSCMSVATGACAARVAQLCLPGYQERLAEPDGLGISIPGCLDEVLFLDEDAQVTHTASTRKLASSSCKRQLDQAFSHAKLQATSDSSPKFEPDGCCGAGSLCIKQSPEWHASPFGAGSCLRHDEASALESLGRAPAAAAFLIKDADPLPFGEGPTSTSGCQSRRTGTRILASAGPKASAHGHE